MDLLVAWQDEWQFLQEITLTSLKVKLILQAECVEALNVPALRNEETRDLMAAFAYLYLVM
jgi:hypothetical protein